MEYPYIITQDNLTVFVGGRQYTIRNDHVNYEEVHCLLTQVDPDEFTEDYLVSLLSEKQAVAQAFSSSGIEVTEGGVYRNGQQVHGYLASRMVEFVRSKQDVQPLVNFMQKLYENPSKTAVDELYLWLEQANMPITSGGNFLAYKKVADDYSSYHRGPNGEPVMNLIGTRVEMPRNQVDDQRNRTCSYGLHFCSWQYLPSYMGGRGRVLVVEVNPSEVVSIPSDHSDQKGRACGYVVRSEIKESDAEFAFEGRSVVSFDEPEYDFDDDDGDLRAWSEFSSEIKDDYEEYYRDYYVMTDYPLDFSDWLEEYESIDLNA